MDKEKNTYLYSAAESKEIKRIREKYETPEKKDSKMDQLRKLDASVRNAAVASSLAVGTIGALILGFGMSCALVWSDKMFTAGIVFGIIGIIIAAFAYPVYKTVTEKKRKKVAPLILKLTDELLK